MKYQENRGFSPVFLFFRQDNLIDKFCGMEYSEIERWDLP